MYKRFRLMAFQERMAAAMSTSEYGLLVTRQNRKEFGVRIESKLQNGNPDTSKEKKNFRVVFPINPVGTLLWLFLKYDEIKALRWFLSDTKIEIGDGKLTTDGKPVIFEEKGVEIQTARAMWNIVVASMMDDYRYKRDGWNYFETSLDPRHRLRQLYESALVA